jgi:DNA replication protein DnaC
MLATPTLDKLHALKLLTLAQAWQEQHQNAELAALSFDERFGLLVDAEWLARENKRVARALQEAKLKLPQACIEAIDYPARRELDKAVIRQLATCRWIAEHQQVLVTGATGTGKSFVACALAHQACRRGYRAYYRRASRLFDDLKLAHADGTSGRLLGKLARMDVLVVGDWGWPPCRTRSGAISSRSSRIDMAPARRSSPASCRPPNGTTTSPTSRWPTPSAIGSSTTLTGSC